MSTENQAVDLSSHYFVQFLEGKKSYRLEKLSKIAKLKSMKKEDLTKE